MNTEPVRAALIPVALLAFAAAAQAFIDGANWRGIIAAVLGALIVAAQELARKYVTPTAKVESWRPKNREPGSVPRDPGVPEFKTPDHSDPV